MKQRQEERDAAARRADSVAARERETEEAVEAERAEVARGLRKDSKGTWAEVRDVVPGLYPNEDAGFAAADTDGDGAVSATEFRAFARQAGFTNGEELFRSCPTLRNPGVQSAKLSRAEFVAAFGDLSQAEVKA